MYWYRESQAQDDEGEDFKDWSKETADSPFLFLSLEIPPTPLFKDSQVCLWVNIVFDFFKMFKFFFF